MLGDMAEDTWNVLGVLMVTSALVALGAFYRHSIRTGR